MGLFCATLESSLSNVAYEWRAYECELVTPCSIVDIVGSDRNSSLYNSCSVCSESGRPVEVEQN